MKVIRDELTYRLIGAAIEVHKNLGPGFLEFVYHEALAYEFEQRGIEFRHEVSIPIYYKNQLLKTRYRADFVCFSDVLVEIKAISQISGTDKAQVINYLKATGLEKGLLFNFGSRSLQYKRMFNNFDA